MKKLTLLLLILVSTSLVFAGTGTSGAQFMQIGAGVRALSMGSAFVGLAEGIDAVYWNPAGLASSQNMMVTFGHTDYFADMSFENLGLSFPMGDGVIAISGIALLSGNIEETTVEDPDGTGNIFTANDYAFGVTYSMNMTEKFSLGVTGRVISQSLAELSALGWAMDIGAVYRVGLLNNLRIGFAIQNFGPDLRYTGDDLLFRTKVYADEDAQAADARAEYLTEMYQMPLTFQVGIAIDVIDTENSKLVAVVDGINPNDQMETMGMGLEFSFQDSYFLRAGYTDKNEKGLSAGAGLKTNAGGGFGAGIDYGYEAHQYLGDLHRFAVTLSF
jgi:hypothetical protein